jgi:dienelactone hydrolase
MDLVMKYLFLILILGNCEGGVFAQKPPIDSSVYGKWPSLGDVAISNDGKYALYNIDNLPVKCCMLIIQSLRDSWKLQIRGILTATFTKDSRLAIFRNAHDSLCLVALGTSSVEYIPHINSFKLSRAGSGDWLAYKLGNSANNFVIRNLRTGQRRTMNSVIDYVFTNDGTGVLIRTESKNNYDAGETLTWLNLVSNKMAVIYRGAKTSNFVFDNRNTCLAFSVEDKVDSMIVPSFWYYKVGMDKAILLADRHSCGIALDLQLDDIIGFSNNDDRLFISLRQIDRQKLKPNVIQLNIWSYVDPILQPRQIAILKANPVQRYMGILFLRDNHIMQFSFKNEVAINILDGSNHLMDLALISRLRGDVNTTWDKFNDSMFLVSTIDGSRRLLQYNLHGAVFSLDGKFAIYYDPLKDNYFSYETKSGINRNITSKCNSSWVSIATSFLGVNSAERPIGWTRNGERIILYDTYDIWEVDPFGNKPPIELTNGYGRKHHIVFRFVNDLSFNTFSSHGKLVLSAFNRDNKDNGFFSIKFGRQQDPELLTMGHYTYYAPQKQGAEPYSLGIRPVKGGNTESYIVSRMSAHESNNLYYTDDFRIFNQISNLAPESNYNWMTTELLTWKILDGTMTQGILYKPENFDPKRKYPVIFHYYQLRSDDLNTCLRPEPSDGDLNIAWYVSNGYLVVEPDIYLGNNGRFESSFSTVISAANYLATFPYVDAKKMGIQGHSWGGIQTNYILTRTHLFAAACSGSSESDYISFYGELHHGGIIGEKGPASAPASLWEDPGWYILHSPVMNADKVTIPLLMFETTHDDACPFVQAIEFFTDLRRLGKKVWMLEYEDANHSVWGRSAADFSIRMSQFFNYYLKGLPAPKWMIEGVPASKKGVDDGLDLEPAGIGPGPGLLSPEEQRKVDSLQNRGPVTITIK